MGAIGGTARGVAASGFANDRRRYSGDPFSHLEGKRLNGLTPVVKSLCSGLNEGGVENPSIDIMRPTPLSNATLVPGCNCGYRSARRADSVQRRNSNVGLTVVGRIYNSLWAPSRKASHVRVLPSQA